jgi:hypothetical protein
MAANRTLKVGLTAAAVGAVLIQFIPSHRENPPVETEVAAPAEVRAILRRACYDCHSNETVWPWYAHVAPVSWLIERDVREGRREANFSTWNRNDARRQARKWKEIREQVEKKEMPPWIYTTVHGEARLSEADSRALLDWASRSSAAR